MSLCSQHALALFSLFPLRQAQSSGSNHFLLTTLQREVGELGQANVALARDVQGRDARLRELDRRLAEAQAVLSQQQQASAARYSTAQLQISQLQLALRQQEEAAQAAQQQLQRALQQLATLQQQLQQSRQAGPYGHGGGGSDLTDASASSLLRSQRALFPAYVQLKRENDELK